ncbi:hypothetical protein B0H13DRAFT_2513013 [Mycena leptocephala]|nr:hypothetical protein B0H13DRAFT_2513013 [Mycena leptocephala]
MYTPYQQRLRSFAFANEAPTKSNPQSIARHNPALDTVPHHNDRKPSRCTVTETSSSVAGPQRADPSTPSLSAPSFPPPHHCADERPTPAQARGAPHLHEPTATLQARLHRAHAYTSAPRAEHMYARRWVAHRATVVTTVLHLHKAVFVVARKAIHYAAPRHNLAPSLNTTAQRQEPVPLQPAGSIADIHHFPPTRHYAPPAQARRATPTRVDRDTARDSLPTGALIEATCDRRPHPDSTPSPLTKLHLRPRAERMYARRCTCPVPHHISDCTPPPSQTKPLRLATLRLGRADHLYARNADPFIIPPRGAPHPHGPTATLRASLHSLATSASRIVATITPPRSAPRAQWTYAGSAPHDAPHLDLRVCDEARWQHPALDEARSAFLTRNGCKYGDLPNASRFYTRHADAHVHLAPRTPNSCDASCPQGPHRPHRPIAAFQLYDPPPPLILSLIRHRSPACSPTQHRKTSRTQVEEDDPRAARSCSSLYDSQTRKKDRHPSEEAPPGTSKTGSIRRQREGRSGHVKSRRPATRPLPLSPSRAKLAEPVPPKAEDTTTSRKATSPQARMDNPAPSRLRSVSRFPAIKNEPGPGCVRAGQRGPASGE